MCVCGWVDCRQSHDEEPVPLSIFIHADDMICVSIECTVLVIIVIVIVICKMHLVSNCN